MKTSRVKVFKSEIADGLKDLILAGQKFFINASIKPAKVKSETKPLEIVAAQMTSPVFYAIDNILCSVGNNDNDDCFLPQELFNAYMTSVDKPVNIDHVYEDIVGHTVSSCLVDSSYIPLAADMQMEELPDFFHILNQDVLYLNWRDEAKSQQMATIIAEIENDKWAVSMECLAPGFDYGIFDGEQMKLVARDDNTAFLSKYLRAYGGDGLYDGKKIVRVPRNITFSAKALTKTPANPDSIILNKNKVCTASQNENVYLSELTNPNVNGEDSMPNELFNDELKKLIQDVNGQVSTEIINGFASKMETFLAELDLKAKLEVSNAKIVELEKAFAELTAANAELSNKLNAEIVKNKTVLRVAKLVSAGLTDTKAGELVEKTLLLDDEAFSLVAEQVSVKPVTESVVDDIKKIETVEENKPETVVTASSNSKPSVTEDFMNFWASSTKKSK